MAGFLDDLFGAAKTGLQEVGNAGVDLGKTLLNIPVSVATAIPDFINNPDLFLNDNGQLDPRGVGSLLSRDYRKSRQSDMDLQNEMARDMARAEKIANGVNIVKTIFGDNMGGVRTDTARQAYGQALQQNAPGLDVFPFIMGTQAEADAARAAAGEAGAMPNLAKIADINSAQQLGQTRFASDRQLKEIGARGAETRRSQGNQAGLQRANMYAQEEEQARRLREGEKFKKRLGRRDERLRGKAFADAMPDILRMGETPDGAAALASNPALRGMVVLGKSVQDGNMSPALAEEIFKGTVHAAQSGATVQDKLSAFGTTTATDSRRQEEIDNSLGEVADMDWLEQNFDPAYISIPGRGKLAIQTGLNTLGIKMSPKSFLSKRTDFAARAQNSYLKFRKFVTGVAGEGNKQLGEELSLAIPDINRDLAPDVFLAKVRSVKAARAAVAARLVALGKSVADLTPADKESLGRVALDAVRATDAEGLPSDEQPPSQAPPLEQMDRASKEAELRRRLQGMR